MARVFQSFVYNFLKTERSDLVIERERFHWRAESESKASLDLLPAMETDVSIYTAGRHIILDTKFYRETVSERFGVPKLHVQHVYQLFSYLANSNPVKGRCEGILLYPTVNADLNAQFSVLGFPISVRTLNLAQPWQGIHSDLLNLIPA